MHGKCITQPVLAAILGWFVTPVLHAQDAVYSVQLNPARNSVTVKIDTRPWPANQQAPTASLTVRLRQADGSSVIRKLDFLKGVTSPTFLKADEVYLRSLSLGEVAAVAIESSSMIFPNAAGKVDGPELAATAGEAGSPTVNVAAPVVVPPPPPPSMTLEPGMDRFGMDLSSQPRRTASAASCAALCTGERRCRAYTFVKADGAGGACWLKSAVPAPSPCQTCTSGVKRP